MCPDSLDPAATAAPSAPRLLFIPVSGAFGMGEFARCLNLALSCRSRWPEARIHFLLSAQAPYAQSLPFECTRLPSSPTFHTPEVVQVIRQFEPQLVVFDNAGRGEQLAAARRAGAALVYISARRRQRRKAFRLRWLRMLDEHWIAWPRFMAGPLSPWERIKLRLAGSPTVRYLDCLLPRIGPGDAAALRARLALREPFVLLVPGGGTGHPRARAALDEFREAGRRLAGSGVRCLLVAPGAGASSMSATGPAAGDCLTGSELLPLPELLALIEAAALVVCNGGDTLIQAMAMGAACVAVPIAADQPARIRACVRHGAARACPLEAGAIDLSVRSLLAAEAERRELSARARALGLTDGLEQSVEAIDGLLRSVAI